MRRPPAGPERIADDGTVLHHLLDAIDTKVPLSDLDWARTLLLTEICWASDLLGAGIEFATNIRDEKAAPLLRSIPNKISSYDRFALLVEYAQAHITR